MIGEWRQTHDGAWRCGPGFGYELAVRIRYKRAVWEMRPPCSPGEWIPGGHGPPVAGGSCKTVGEAMRAAIRAFKARKDDR